MKEKKVYPCSWEEAIEILRADPEHEKLIFDSYLTRDLVGNCQRFVDSEEWTEVLSVIQRYMPNAQHVLDMPAGNGIATYAFASAKFQVTSVEPDASATLGRQAIEQVLKVSGLPANIVNAWGEKLPFADNYFDVVYVRQGLHHASDLNQMLLEIHRVLAVGGVMIACREHVVDNYHASLDAFLSTQVDHQLYGGEYAFTLADYRAAIQAASLQSLGELKPFDSMINVFPNSFENIGEKILASPMGRSLTIFLPKSWVLKIGFWVLNRRKTPGRIYSFIARKKTPDNRNVENKR